MTTYSDLDKYGRDEFIPSLKKMGFKHFRSFIFVRVSPRGLHHLLLSQILRSGESLRISPHIWVPEFEVTVDPKRYPKALSIRAEFPRWNYPEWQDVWDIQSESQCRDSFSLIETALEEAVIPWFDGIRSAQAFIQALNPEAASNNTVIEAIPTILQRYP